MTEENTSANTAENNSTTPSSEGAAANTVGVARLYEIINKKTGVVEPVNRDGSGDVDGDMDADFICHKEDGSEVIFKREGQDGNNAIFVNPDFLIRDRESKLALDGVTLVADVVPEAPADTDAAPSSEGAVEGTFNVLDKDGNVTRTFSVELHGEDAESQARNFAHKFGGTVQ